jgi:hypothetical protein
MEATNKRLLISESRGDSNRYTPCREKPRPIRHVRFARQSTYARRTLPVVGPRTWQYFTLIQQNWTDSLLLRKGAPDSTSQPVWVVRGTHLSFSPKTAIELCRQHATRLTGPISSVCDRYIQYLLMGTNPSFLNRHRRGLPHRKPRNSHNTLPALPFWGFHRSL